MALRWLLVFWAMFVIEYCWTQYIIAAAKGSRLRAAAMTVAIVVLGGVSTLLFVHDPWLLIPEAIGAGAGTLYAMKK